MPQVLEYLPSKHEALLSNSSTAKKEVGLGLKETFLQR
jgi:hypothetical protein